MDTTNALQQSIIKVLKQAQEKVQEAKERVNNKMKEAMKSVRNAQQKVIAWREGKLQMLIF